MTDHTTAPTPGREPDNPGSTPSHGEHDLSMRGTPAEWFEAERESPQDQSRAGVRAQANPTVMPIRRKIQGSTLLLAGFVAMVVTGACWTAAEILGLWESPWLALPAGVLIALIVRASCGREDPQGRSTIAAIAYLFTFLVVMTILTRREVYEIYGDSGDVALLEQNLFRRRFSSLDQLAAYVIGWAMSWYASIWLRH